MLNGWGNFSPSSCSRRSGRPLPIPEEKDEDLDPDDLFDLF